MSGNDIPPERRCPICGSLNVNPHRDSLCPDHYPADAPEITPLHESHPSLSKREVTLQEARAVAGEEPGDDVDGAEDPAFELLDRYHAGRSPEEGSASEDSGSFLAAAMGDPQATPQYSRDDVDTQEPTSTSAGGVGMPIGSLPLAQLDALAPAERRRAARKRGLDWPTTAQARDRLQATINDVIRQKDHRVVDAPTSLGKTHTVASTRWGAREDVTGGRPVVHLLETRDARDEAVEIAEEHGGDHLVLQSRHEACPVAAGDYDPEQLDESDERKPITIEGEPASEWLDAMCDGRGIPFSAAHRHLEDHNDQGQALPCCSEEGSTCPAIAQWEHYREGDYPLVIATHNFAFAPGLRLENNLVVDEEPDYVQDLSTDRVRRAVGAYLRRIDATVQTWEAFIQLAGYDGYGDDAAHERDALESDLDAEPDRAWYFADPDAHILAPALARAIFHADARANNRRVGKTPYEPPRLEAGAHDTDEWNREWVSVVLDETNDVRTVRVVPDFNAVRSLVGLDAHPALPKWQANTVPWIQHRRVLDPEERQLWRRYERGLRVVQVGDATRPLTSGEYFDRLGAEALLEQLVEEYGGDQVRTAITADAIEDELAQIMSDVGAVDPETMHFGEEKSRNDFADEDVGLVNGCIDPGDEHVLDLLAELDLEAEPEWSDPEACDDPENAECGHCDGEGCQACLGTGLKRAQGRGFTGEDADTAAAILASVRENHTAQAAGRYARNPDVPGETATVFVRTDAMPPGFADVTVPGVTWTFSGKQEQILTVLRESARPLSGREISDRADCSKEHVRSTLEKLIQDEDDDRQSPVQAIEHAGDHGATLYAENGLPNSGVADLGAITNRPVWGSYTWSLAIRESVAGTDGDDTAITEGGSDSSTVWNWKTADQGGG